MSTELIVNASLPETRVALLENGEIQELLIERANGKGIVGNIYKGRVTRVLPGMQAAFVDIGLEKAAFLYVDDVYVHSELWEDEEGPSADAAFSESEGEDTESEPSESSEAAPTENPDGGTSEESAEEATDETTDTAEESDESEDEEGVEELEPPVDMGADDEDEATNSEVVEEPTVAAKEPGRARRGNNKGRGRNRKSEKEVSVEPKADFIPDNFREQMSDDGAVTSDRASVSGEVESLSLATAEARTAGADAEGVRKKFKEQRSRDRRIRPKGSNRPARAAVNIQDLLKEGQEVLVQIAKDPIATKGARLTCHISLPGRHLVCMPTIDHVGVSRRIERDDERRRLREYVDRNRPRGVGFIVRTATAGGKQSSEKRIKQDIDYLSHLWEEIRSKASELPAPALIYEDLNPVLRAIRDWVNEDIDKIVIDSRYQHNEATRFVRSFMPAIQSKVELYQGDIPIFDAYSISSDLSRALERKVWLKSGGYIVVDQAEALVAIDVNTGRYVGKRNLEDTILKTNLEAVKEIAYQLRLRNCGGIIILDLIDMEKEENKFRVYRALEEELKKDRARPQILKISELGLVEMTRKRTRDTMVRALCDPCTQCEGKGFVKSRQTVAYEILRDLERAGVDRDVPKILVQAHPEVIDALAIDERETLDQIERRYKKTIYLQAVQDFHLERFEVIHEKKGAAQVSEGDILERARESAQVTDPRARRGRERERTERDRGERSNKPKVQIQTPGAPGIVVKPKLPQPLGLGPRPEVTQAPGLDESKSNVGEFSADGEAVAQTRSISTENQDDGDAIGNRVEGPKGFDLDSEDGSPSQGAQHDDFFTEEDRIAYLRAQAAQDAAIASLGAGGNGSSPGNGGRAFGGGQGRRDRGFGGGKNFGKQGGGGRNPRNNNNRPSRFSKSRGPNNGANRYNGGPFRGPDAAAGEPTPGNSVSLEMAAAPMGNGTSSSGEFDDNQ